VTPFVAALVVALAFNPARVRVQRGVDRLFFGRRGDPLALLHHLDRTLRDAGSPHAALRDAAGVLRSGLRLPGAAVVVTLPSGDEVRAEDGVVPGAAHALPLDLHGEQVGTLLVAPRRPGEPVRGTDLRVLSSLAGPLASAAYALRLAGDLEDSRRRLLEAREEERRRLRRDLHDGLGPVLAGQVLRLETARDLVDADPARTRDLLDRAVVEAVSSLEEVRRVVDGLRPPTLDDDGLALAVRNRVHQLADRVEVSTTEPLPRMRAAVEVAAYHIVSEAVSNAVRHAPGARCGVTIRAVDGELVVTVADDGPGINGQARAARVGAGLTTMRERAAEIGGRLEVGPAPGGGTAVVARLPLEGPGLATESEGARA
jgi:signal transduction histidine kinase